jgi:hypothetical protein
MVKNITTIIFNSLESDNTLNNNSNVSFFTINTPPIEIKKQGILKVSNFCHIGTAQGHTDNMYIFRVRGINADTSKCLSGRNAGFPTILTTTLNNNRSLYDENIITLTRQTINSIDIIVDTYLIAHVNGTFNRAEIEWGGVGYLVGNILTFTGGGSTPVNVRVATIFGGGIIRTLTFVDTPTSLYSSTPTLSAVMNGSGATFTTVAPATAGPLTSITVSNGGLGYRVGQVITITATGASGATCTITAVNASTGAITTLSTLTGGTGYITTNARTVTVDANYYYHSALIIPTMIFPKIIEHSFPNNLIFSITFTIEQDEF